MSHTITVIIVNYHSRDHLKRALDSLAGSIGDYSLEVIVVNNSAAESLASVVSQFHFSLQIITPPLNIGFARAVNIGLVRATGTFVLLMNPDTLAAPDMIQKLISVMEVHPDVASIGPQISYPNGRLQPSRGRFPSLFSSFSYLFRLKKLMPRDELVIRWGGKLLGLLFEQYRPLEQLQDVDYTVGSCLFLRKRAIEEIGGFDGRFFLFYEEIDLALRLARKGWRRIFDKEAHATHQVGGSYSEDQLIGFREKYLSMSLYFSKHFGTGVNLVLRLMQILALTMHLFVSFILSKLSYRTIISPYTATDLCRDMLHLFVTEPLLRTSRDDSIPFVSACLLGVPCTLRKTSHPRPQLISLYQKGACIGFCPEHAGGLLTPRAAAEIRGGDGNAVIDGAAAVVTQNGTDVTKAFLKGAYRALLKARLHGCRLAILKARSPSCGVDTIHDGSFSNTLIAGAGVTAALLQRWGIVAKTDEKITLR